MSVYVGFKIGKASERKAYISEYYCGACGWPVSDHDSYCPECGGAFRKEDATERMCHGYMNTDYYSGTLDKFSCSNCGIEWTVDDGMVQTTKVSYCPNCGAKVIDNE